jgi:PAS domain S-box-containing protein
VPEATAGHGRELSAIYEYVPGILFYVAVEPDGDFRFLSMSDAGLAAIGLRRDQVVGALVGDVIPSPSREVVLNHYRDAIRSGGTVRWKEVSEYPAGRKMGEVAVTALYDAKGVATHLIGVVHDITERERLEAALQEREKRLAFLLQLNDALRPLGDPVEIQNVTVRLLGEHLGVNRVAYSVIDGDEFIVTADYNHGVAPLRGRWSIAAFGARLLDEYRRGETVISSNVSTDPRLTDAERAAQLNHGVAAFLRVMLHKDGRWVAAFGVNSVTPREWTPDERILVEQTAERLWSAAERARAEAALRDREQRLRLALKASAAGSWTRESGAQNVEWDDGFRRLYGIPPDEPGTFAGWLSRVHEEDRAHVLGLVDEMLRAKDDMWDISFRIVRPDGTTAWIQSVGRVERDATGEVTRLAGLEMDVSVRRQAETALQAERDRAHDRELHVLLETATQGIVSVDPSGTIVTANRAFEIMFGWSEGELIGQPIERLLPAAFRAQHEQHRTSYFVEPHSRIMGGGLQLIGERRDGTQFPVEVSLNHVGPFGGGRAFAFVSDITERQERTTELEHRTAQLSRLASDLTLAEHHAREQIAKMLHDSLQQLLVIASMNLDEHIKRPGQAPSELIEKAKGHLDDAIAAARTLSFELSPPVLQHAELAEALVWLATWMHQKYGLNVHVSADPRATSRRKDVRTLLFESTRELLFNVVKHAKVDRVTLDLGLDVMDQLCITVSDQGIGFNPTELGDRLKAGVVGWGLFSIRERVTLLGGRFDVDSTPGRGTRFRLVAPRGAAQNAASAPAPTRSAAVAATTTGLARQTSREALRILIVDDHVAVREAFTGVLQQYPGLCVVGVACDGLDAIAQAHRLRPDVILMDISMPYMDGVEATRRIRSEFPFIQILGLSMQPHTESPHAIEQAGAAAFFVKGTDTQPLIDHLLRQQHHRSSDHPTSWSPAPTRSSGH